jgi:transposase
MTTEIKAKKEALPYNAQQRAQAVLSIWSERRRPGEVCQDLGISSAVLSHWEKRALAAMLKALESQTRLEPGPALSPKLERRLARQALQQKGRLAISPWRKDSAMNDAKPTAHQQALARQRAQLIMQVQNGLVSAQEAARQLRISRKTYYKWQRRALAAMVEALGNREHGRPTLRVDPENEALQRQSQELQAQLLVMEQTVRIRQGLEQPDKKKE